MKKHIRSTLIIIALIFLPFSAIAETKETKNYENRDEQTKKDQNSISQVIEIKGKKIRDRHRIHLEDNFSQSFTIEKIFSEDLEEKSITDVKSALKEIPNVNVVSNGAFSKDVEIRGLSGERIITEVDGIKISNQGLSRSGGGESNLVDTGTIDSIELVKGSPSILYDPGASGGLIKINTKKARKGNFADLKHNFIYDDGYEKTKNSTSLSGGLSKGIAEISILGTISKTLAEKYNIKDREELDLMINNTNKDEYREGTPHEIKDLGYEDESKSFKLRLDLAKKNHFQFSASDYSASDIKFTIPGLNSRILVTDRFERDSENFSYRLDDFKALKNFKITGSSQTIKKGNFYEGLMTWTELDSDIITTGFDIIVPEYDLIITTGGELTEDSAETLVTSDQEYYALYLNLGRESEKFSYSAGLRWNSWEANHKLPPGMDEELALLLNDISGWLPDPITDETFTYAAGAIYHLNESNNLSVNYSRTHRFPTLYERFAFDSFIGGGVGLKAEKAHNLEMAWKYLSKNTAFSISGYYSSFDDYLGNKTRANEKRDATQEDKDNFAACNNDPNCPEDVWQDAFDELYETKVYFENLGRVESMGFEITFNTLLKQVWEFEVTTGMSDFQADEVFAEQESNPLEFNAYIKKYFILPFEPWAKLSARSVTGWPDVEEIGDKSPFEPFTLLNFSAGGKYQFRYGEISLNGGVRNLANTLYNEPFSVLNGLKRTYFVNAGINLIF